MPSTSSIPPELAKRVAQVSAELAGLEERLAAVEAFVRQALAAEPPIKQLRHDFASIRMLVNLLMEEIEQAAPTPKPPRGPEPPEEPR